MLADTIERMYTKVSRLIRSPLNAPTTSKELTMTLANMTNSQLMDVLASSKDEAAVDAVYDELDQREEAEGLIDWTESDRDAYTSEVLEMYRNEY